MSPLATVGILSIGEMGMGIARLLIAHNYRVVTNVSGRSQDTLLRVQKAAIEILPTDEALVSQSDYILSIVPPRDALSIASRITTAFNVLSSPKARQLYYLDLNAISPRTARLIASHFATAAPRIKFLDGGIIGGPPSLKNPSAASTSSRTTSARSETTQAWNRPSIPLSGEEPLSASGLSGQHLEQVLNINHISPKIGLASGLKCCFATTTKGFGALAIQAFTTASALGVLPLLKQEMSMRYPEVFKAASGIVIAMPPKSYRWVREMEEIGLTHAEEGGFVGGEEGKGIFDAIAELYRSVAEDTVLGEEKAESRKRGRTVEDVAQCVADGLRSKRRRSV